MKNTTPYCLLGILLLVALPILVGCHNEEATNVEGTSRHLELQLEREKEARRMAGELRDADLLVSLDGAKLLISEPSPKDFNESKLVCYLHESEFRASLFDAVEVVTPDYDTRKMSVQIHLALPVRSGIPAGCELPPGVTGMR